MLDLVALLSDFMAPNDACDRVQRAPPLGDIWSKGNAQPLVITGQYTVGCLVNHSPACWDRGLAILEDQSIKAAFGQEEP